MSDGKVKWSNFSITVNLNKSPDCTSPEMIQQFAEWCEDMVSSDYLFLWLLQYDPETRSRHQFDDEEKPRVKRIRQQVALEAEGQTNKSLHAHWLLEIAHTTLVQLDYHTLQNLCNTRFGIGSNVKGRFVPGDPSGKQFLIEYLWKTTDM